MMHVQRCCFGNFKNTIDFLPPRCRHDNDVQRFFFFKIDVHKVTLIC